MVGVVAAHCSYALIIEHTDCALPKKKKKKINKTYLFLFIFFARKLRTMSRERAKRIALAPAQEVGDSLLFPF